MLSSPQTTIASSHLTSSLASVSNDAAPLISAYLLKQSAGKWKRKRWNQRWFVLDRKKGILRYFRHAAPLKDLQLRHDAHGALLLKQKNVSLVIQGDLPRGVPTPFCFTILVDGHSDLRLCAETNTEFRQWTTAISAIINPARPYLRVTEETKLLVPSSPLSVTATLPSNVGNFDEKREKIIERQEATIHERHKEMEVKQVIKQLWTIIGNEKVVLFALNPVIVLVRFGSVSIWCLVVVLANAMFVWLLWLREPDACLQLVSSRTASEPLTCGADEKIPPKGPSPVSISNSEIANEGSDSRMRAEAEPRTLAASTSSVAKGFPPKRPAFSGKINGVKTSAGASLKMCAPSPTPSVDGCWTHVEATRFHVRQGPNYRKTKLKASSKAALLELVAVDIYQSDIKVDNVGSIVDLRSLQPETGELDLFIVNCQVPSYQPSNPLWGEKQDDGVGFNFVTYFAIPPAIREMIDKPGEPSHQAVRLLKNFMQAESWVSERFKAIGIVVNPHELQLGRAERRLLETYNGQPILTRPQHVFYHGKGYFEVDVNAHEFNYIARKGLVGVSTHACNMMVDFGYVLEGQEDDELPEQVLGCVRLCKVDVRKAPRLA